MIAARFTFVELAHADALLDELASRFLSAHATPAEARAYFVPVNDATAWRETEFAAVSSLLCWKCAGRGVTQWKHRSRGVCFSCKGDGWSAKGRRVRSGT